MLKRSRPDSDPPFKNTSSASDDGEGHGSSAHTPKYAQFDDPEPQPAAMRCSLPPHKSVTFSTYAEYDAHYNSEHMNRCSECSVNLPTAHFLDLHIAENHDPLLAAKSERGEKIYGCFVEDCEKVCRDWKKRRSHLVDKHGYPRNYDFLVVNTGLDGRRTVLRPGVDSHGHRKSSRERRTSGATATTQATETTESIESIEPTEASQDAASASAWEPSVRHYKRPTKQRDRAQADTPMDGLVQSMSALKMIPRSVTFGRRKGKAGFAKS